MMATETSMTSARAWAPDLQEFAAEDAVPDALILKAATIVETNVEGDGPVVRIPWADDAGAGFVSEGAAIDEANPGLSEVAVRTGRVSQLIRVSREQWVQERAAALLSTSAQRAVVRAANAAFVAQAAPAPDTFEPPAGIFNTTGILDGGTIGADLDAIADVIAQIEANGGLPGVILASPLAWGELRKLKTVTGANTTLLGAGTEDQAKRLHGVEVITTPAMGDGDLLVIDPAAIAAAVGKVMVAQSEHAYFSSDSVALRVTWRIGWGVQHASRIAKLHIVGDYDES